MESTATATEEVAAASSTIMNPLQISEDERGDPGYDEELEMCRRGMEAMGYSAGDYDDFRRMQTSDSTEFLESGNAGQPCTSLGDNDLAYRAMYCVSHTIVFVVLVSLPGLDWTAFNISMLAFLIASTGGLFFSVQGSDPGYLQPPEDFVAPVSSSKVARHERQRRRQLAPMQPDGAERQALADEEASPEHGLASRLAEMEHRFPPMRAILCKAKGQYVAKFDHFCAFLNTPIGEKNHFRFWWFLFSETCLILHSSIVIKSSFRWFSGPHGSDILPAVFFTIFLDVLLLMIGGLWVFHTFLALTSSTTFEFMRGDEIDYLEGTDDFDFPFSSNVHDNLKRFCWTHGFQLLSVPWQAYPWRRPVKIDRESTDCWNNPWQNKYYSCC